MEKIAIIGAGSMSEALIAGIVENQLISPEKIWVTNRSNADRLATLHEQYGVSSTYDHRELLEGADMVLLAMKPKDAAASIEQVRHLLKSNMLIVSVLAGVSMDSIELLSQKQLAIVRAMPNTSATVGLSATAIAVNDKVDDDQKRNVQMLFGTVGMTAFVEEHQLDAVTGLSGSGPAYIYYLIEAMEKSAVEIGLEREMAQQLIVQTLIGAAQMVAKTTKTPQELRHAVTSPGGTTEAGLKVLAAHGVQEAFVECIKEATAQSKRMGKAIAEQMESVQRSL
ncbi:MULTISPECIES: pyrroline-5-carboxylate reductase [Robertmurraya]|uniref:Pyrroline-5-carboxylate reductase n=1 Tax=Robertmurraya beringensis TaxID=641660 RepID=A0ABV6KXR2_9BACI